MYKKKLGQTYYTNRHSCFLLQYHIVLVTKNRRPVLTGAVKELVCQVIQDIFDEKDLVILEMNGEADHIHRHPNRRSPDAMRPDSRPESRSYRGT